MTSRLRETAPLVGGVLGGLVVVGSVIVLLVTLPEIADLFPPTSSASPSASPTAAASPSQSASPTAGASPSSSAEVGLRPGQLAPPLEVDRLDGGTINLAALRGQAVWLNFLASWCPPCYDEMPTMEGYWTRLKDKGLVIVGIDIKETREEAEALVKQVGVTFPVGIDPTSTTEQYWSAYAMPVHFWIDREGVVRAFAFGGIGRDRMEEGLSTILPEEFPTPAPTTSPTASP